MDLEYFKKLFDWQFYVSNHKDLQDAKIDSFNKAWHHLNTHAWKETRIPFKDPSVFEQFKQFKTGCSGNGNNNNNTNSKKLVQESGSIFEIKNKRVLVNTHSNLDISAGDTIMISNIINVLLENDNKVTLVSKFPITKNFTRNLIVEDNNNHSSNFTSSTPTDSSDHKIVSSIDEYSNNMDIIFLRNHEILHLLENKNYLFKTIIYGLDIHLEGIKRLNNKFLSVITQSEQLKQRFIEYGGVDKNKIEVCEPIVYKYNFDIPERTDNEIRLIYCGTLRDEENILEIIDEFQKIHKKRPEVLLKIVYGKIHGNPEFTKKVSDIINKGVDGITFKHNLSHKDACYEIAISDIGICWRKNGWGDNGEVSTKVREYEMYGVDICFNLDSNLNNILDRYKIHTYVLAYDDYERTIFKSNLIFNLNFEFINGNFNNKIAEDIINENNANKIDFFKNSIYSNSQIKFNNQYGHINAMIHVLNDALINKYENILLLEYDVHFHVILPSILENIINKLNNYPIIYLGSSKHNNCIIDHDKNLYQGMTGTFAIILNKCVFNDFKNKLEQKLYPSDLCLIKVCEKYKPYIGKTDCVISNIEYSTIRSLDYYNNNLYEKFNWIKRYYYFAKREMRLGIVICYRGRKKDLSYFLHAFKYIINDKNYKIIIINQDNNNLFGRGVLFNIGFILIQNIVDYVVFHDVDLIPHDNYYQYDNENKIKHLSKYVSQFKYLVPYNGIFGGVEYFDNKTFEFIDGFHNLIQVLYIFT
jgi:hypothetical protein